MNVRQKGSSRQNIKYQGKAGILPGKYCNICPQQNKMQEAVQQNFNFTSGKIFSALTLEIICRQQKETGHNTVEKEVENAKMRK